MTSIEIQQIIDFVEGKLEPGAFEKLLYENPRFEDVLHDDPHLPPNTYIGKDVYLYVLQQDFKSADGIFNIHAALEQFLGRNGFSVQPTQKYKDFYHLIMSAQPQWLDVDPTYVEREIMPSAGSLSGKELTKWLRAELLKRFRYATSPPHWLQGACWPIGENGPLVFLGQVPVKGYFHDEAAAYVFYDPKTGTCDTTIQVA